jgi:hypothetical protein
MAQPITVHKSSKLSLKAETPPAAEAPAAAAPAPAPVAPVRARQTSGGHSYLIDGLCALIAFFILGALLIFQYVEWDSYTGAFPVTQLSPMGAPSPSAPAMPAPAPAPAPAAETPAQ